MTGLAVLTAVLSALAACSGAVVVVLALRSPSGEDGGLLAAGALVVIVGVWGLTLLAVAP